MENGTCDGGGVGLEDFLTLRVRGPTGIQKIIQFKLDLSSSTVLNLFFGVLAILLVTISIWEFYHFSSAFNPGIEIRSPVPQNPDFSLTFVKLTRIL
jgi:hypothetical protein